MKQNVIYLDYNATTYIHEEVASQMKPYLDTFFGNPSSSHLYGRETKAAVTKARSQIAQMLSCDTKEITFTSGGSESNNLAIKGIVYKRLHSNDTQQNEPFEIMTSLIEHPSVIEVFRYLEQVYKDKLTVIYLPVDQEGIIDMNVFKEKMTKKCALISIMHANNETGAIQPIREIADYAKSINSNVIIHTDAAQSIGKVEVNVDKLGVDLLSVCSHKFYGPKGIGAIYIKKGVEVLIEKLIHGANHESDMRAGTENVLEIVGIGAACELIQKDLTQREKHFKLTRNILFSKLKEAFPEVVLHGPPIVLTEDGEKKRLSNTLYISFPGIKANTIMSEISDKIACSSGAACHSNCVKMSYVLEAMKTPSDIAMGTLRLSTGLKLTEKEAEEASLYLIDSIKKIKNSK